MKLSSLITHTIALALGCVITLSWCRWQVSKSPFHYQGRHTLTAGRPDIDLFEIEQVKGIVMSVTHEGTQRAITFSPSKKAAPACRVILGEKGIEEVSAFNDDQQSISVRTQLTTGLFNGITLCVPKSSVETRVLYDEGLDGVYDKEIITLRKEVKN